MINYDEEIFIKDTRINEDNPDITYIREKIEIHNLDTFLKTIAEQLIYMGFSGIEALSVVTKYIESIKNKFKFSYLAIGISYLDVNKRKENLLGLFEYLHRKTIDEKSIEKKKNIIKNILKILTKSIGLILL